MRKRGTNGDKTQERERDRERENGGIVMLSLRLRIIHSAAEKELVMDDQREHMRPLPSFSDIEPRNQN